LLLRYFKVQVHLDLKGAPPKIEFYSEFFELLARLNVDSLLIEYEDTFPYNGELAQLKASNSYTPDNIKYINDLANKNNIKLVPLVQVLFKQLVKFAF
jgi:hexosaminidase